MFSEGTVVICNGNDQGQLSLTIGTEYTVLSAYTANVKVKNDIGHEAWYNSSRFTQKSATPAKQIKLEVGKTYLTAGGYVVHITAAKLFHNEYYTTIECSPGVNVSGHTIHKVSSDRTNDYKKYGWQYQSDGTIFLGNEWAEKLRITEEFSKLKPAPQGFRYAGGFPQARPPKKGEFYICCISGDAIQASYDEAKAITRIIIEKEESKMPPFQSLPAGFKFASDPPEHRKPKRGEWFIGRDGKPDFAAVDFLNNSYYILCKIGETPKEEVYPKYYAPLNSHEWAFIKRTDKFTHFLTNNDGSTTPGGVSWSVHHDELYKEIPEEIALGRLNKPVAQTPAPPKITEDYMLASDAFTTSAIPKKSMLSYWIAEPIENMLDAAKKSARYVVASSLLAGIGYVSFNPVESLNFVSSCLPKINIKFGDEPPKFVPIREQDVNFVIPIGK